MNCKLTRAAGYLFAFFMLVSLSPNPCRAQQNNTKDMASINTEKREAAFPQDIQRIIDRGYLSVGIYYKDKPPFIMTNGSGELHGLDISLARDIAKYLGVGVVFNREAKTYTELHEFATRGLSGNGKSIDVVISKFSRTYERAKNVRFTQPYVTFRQAVIVNKVQVVKKRIEDYPIAYLAHYNVKIGVREKTSYVEYAQELFKKAEIVEGKWEDLVTMVAKGEITAIMRDEYEIMKLIKKNPELAIKVSVYVLKDRKDHIAIAVPCDSLNLLAWLNIYLESRRSVLGASDLIELYPIAWE